MMLGSRQASAHMRTNSNSSRKENILVSSPGITRTVTFSTLHPNQVGPRVVQGQRVFTTNKPVSPIRLGSPRQVVNRSPPGRRIELGGSKDRMMERDKAVSVVSNEAWVIDQPVSQSLLRKISMLESRVKELHMEKQYLAVELNQRIRQLEQENKKLITMVKDSQEKGSQLKDSDGTEADRNQEEFNLQDELSNQINVNLELREQLDKFIEEVRNRNEKQQLQAQQINNLEDQKTHSKLQLLQNHDEIESLKEKIESLEHSLAKKDENTAQIVEEKEKRILELEEENFSLTNKIEQKDQHLISLQNELTLWKQNHSIISSETEDLRSKVSELQKPVECKKCKDLLHTVFRLNTQLNRK